MKINLDSILVVDIECTCWEPKSFSNLETSEIIQIGLCLLNSKDHTISNSMSIFVKPIKSTVSEFCTKLTGITQSCLNGKGVSYSEAVDYLKKIYKPKKVTWASYGDYDKYMFEKTSEGDRSLYPFSSRHINVKNLFALKYKLDREIGMMGALGKLDLKPEGIHHDGKDDAFNIARILRKVLWDFVE